MHDLGKSQSNNHEMNVRDLTLRLLTFIEICNLSINNLSMNFINIIGLLLNTASNFLLSISHLYILTCNEKTQICNNIRTTYLKYKVINNK